MTEFYGAYGSNLSVRRMAYRCPRAQRVGRTEIEGYRLVYKGSQSGAYLTIEPSKRGIVPLGIWRITESDERALDRYEGYPHFYYKREFKLLLNGREESIMVYIMKENRAYALPNMDYIAVCSEGYKDFSFPLKTLEKALIDTWEMIEHEE